MWPILSVLLNSHTAEALLLYVHICWFSFDALTQGNAYNHQCCREIIVPNVGIEFKTFRLRHHQLSVLQHAESVGDTVTGYLIVHLGGTSCVIYWRVLIYLAIKSGGQFKKKISHSECWLQITHNACFGLIDLFRIRVLGTDATIQNNLTIYHDNWSVNIYAMKQFCIQYSILGLKNNATYGTEIYQ